MHNLFYATCLTSMKTNIPSVLKEHLTEKSMLIVRASLFYKKISKFNLKAKSNSYFTEFYKSYATISPVVFEHLITFKEELKIIILVLSFSKTVP